MPRTKISEFSATAGSNTDIDGINIAEGCSPSGINDAIRELMAQLKDFQAGTAGDSFNGPVGTTTAAAGAFTSLSASGAFALTGDQVQISEGGTGQTTANAAFNALAPSQATHAGKYLKTDGTNTSWDTLDISTADITGTLPVANGGTGVTSSTGTGSVVLSASPTFTGTVSAAALTLSGAATLNGGTANGVAYLNGSKVLTTGSALAFDGSTLATTGNIRLNDGQYLLWGGLNNGLFGSNAFNYVGFVTSGSEAMRLTSTGLGIGTSSPAYKLDVITPDTNGFAGARIRNNDTGSSAYAGLILNANGNTWSMRMGSAAANSNALQFVVDQLGSPTVRATLDSSGNLGLGVTPSANAVGNALFLASGREVIWSGPTGYLSANATYSSGADRYILSGFASSYIQTNGQHIWRTAPSGTAGNAISFTQAMTLDASGNLQLGATSGSGNRLNVVGTGGIRVNEDGASTKVITIRSDFAGVDPSVMVTSNHALLLGTNNTERARITSGGQLLINTTTDGAAAGARLHIQGNTSQTAVSIRAGTDGTPGLYFTNSAGTKVGDIVINNASTTYNTSSDYRLKNITGPVTDSGSYIDSLKPVQGTWKADGSTFVGLIAHEAQEVSRTTVATGVKDGEQMQSMDYGNSEFIANIIAELQSLRARVAALETK